MQTTAAAVVRRIGPAPLLIIESGLQSSSSKSVVQLHQQRRRYCLFASTTTTATLITNNNDNTDTSRGLLQPPIIQKKKIRIRRRMATNTTTSTKDEQHQLQEEEPENEQPEQQKFNSLIDQHYGGGGSLREKISRGLKATTGKSLDDDNSELLHLDELAPISEFHSRGREGTLDLCQLLNDNIQASDQILDVGCGLGGTARYLCSVYGATVTGIDLTQEFVDVGQELNEKVDIISDKVKLVQGSALDLPFPDNTFDIAWTEHVQMNIADKERFYGEIARVLKPNGRLVFHDVFRGTAVDPPMYPTPWAEKEEMSKLATEVEIRAALAKSGLAITNWVDQTAKTVSYFQTALSKIAERGGPPPLGIHLLMGNTAKTKLQNHLLNNEQGRTMVVMCTALKE